MAAELMEGGGQNMIEETSQQPELDAETEKNTTSSENMDLTIEANISELNAVSLDDTTEEIYKLGFSLNDLYKLSLQFYKKDKQNLNFTYANKVQIVALWKQVSCGKFSTSKAPEIGYFDVVGNDRRKAWEALQDMAPDVAKQQFCEILESNVPAYTSFINEKKKEIDAEILRKKLEQEERIRLEEEEKERIRKEVEEKERLRLEEEERQRLALEAEKQRVKEEEEKRLREEAEAVAVAASVEAAALTASSEEAAAAAIKDAESEVVEKEAAIESSTSPKLVTPQVNGNAGSGKAIAPASLWTRPKLQEFINHVKRDASSVLVVGRGETVTIRVPTHEQGSCLFWEFATDYYDVGFGVYFEWSKVKSPAISVNVNESDSDDTLPDDKSEQQIVVHENEDNVEVIDKPNTDEVLPVLRRNSHEEVIVGSHMYPGQGIYLLKFDNSYSLLRSKTLYYRVYYTK